MTQLRYIFIALVCLLPSLARAAAHTAAADTLTATELFIKLPGDALQLIPESTRRDMVDFYEARQAYTPTNALRGQCELLNLDSRYAKVKVSAASEVQMCVLPCGKTQMAAVVYTVDTSGSPDSELLMYSADLKPLPLGKYFKEPQLSMFMGSVKGKEAAALQQLVPFLLVSYELTPTPEGATLTATLNIKGSMTEEDYARIEPYLTTQSITYTWDGKRFALRSNR